MSYETPRLTEIKCACLMKGTGRCRNNNSRMRTMEQKHKRNCRMSKGRRASPPAAGGGGAQLDGHVIKRLPAESKVKQHQQFLSLPAEHECGMLRVSSAVSETLPSESHVPVTPAKLNLPHELVSSPFAGFPRPAAPEHRC